MTAPPAWAFGPLPSTDAIRAPGRAAPLRRALDWPGGQPIWRHHALAALAALAGPLAFLLVTAIPMLTLLPIGATFTALAGNSPINAADSDLLVSLCGLLSGLGMALLLAWPTAENRR
ncbi:hypothetical protein [Micromonospora sp. NPDC050276]|uniref:hypothetical protein n=1 Tax=Micromonospora sp. NPDC050276 TaxID=3364278 RepID=UPI00378A5063